MMNCPSISVSDLYGKKTVCVPRRTRDPLSMFGFVTTPL